MPVSGFLVVEAKTASALSDRIVELTQARVDWSDISPDLVVADPQFDH